MGNSAQTSIHVTCYLPHGSVSSHSRRLSPDDCFKAVQGNTRKFEHSFLSETVQVCWSEFRITDLSEVSPSLAILVILGYPG